MSHRIGLTNLELAANSTWVIASTFFECHFCGHLSRGPGLDRHSVPCPNCGRAGWARMMWPSMASIRWLQIIADSYLRAYQRVGEENAEMAKRISEDLRRECDPKWVANAARIVRKLLRQSRGSKREYRRFLESLKRRLQLDTEGDAVRLYPVLASHRGTTSEHYTVVVSTAALFDKLMSDFIMRLLQSRGDTQADAKRKVSQMHRRDDLKKSFRSATGVSLEKAVSGFKARGLYESWQQTNKRRNDTLHRTPEAVDSVFAEKAFDAAKNSFGLFAYLHNRFCLAAMRPSSGG
jgi:hypothetical protein